MTQTNYQKFITNYYGSDLLKNHSLNETGIWEILGEDPNCDMSGSHVQPHLATIEGKLDDIIHYAVSLSGFWGWGHGGCIKKVIVQQFDSKKFQEQIDIKRQIEQLDQQRQVLELKLHELDGRTS